MADSGEAVGSRVALPLPFSVTHKRCRFNLPEVEALKEAVVRLVGDRNASVTKCSQTCGVSCNRVLLLCSHPDLEELLKQHKANRQPPEFSLLSVKNIVEKVGWETQKEKGQRCHRFCRTQRRR